MDVPLSSLARNTCSLYIKLEVLAARQGRGEKEEEKVVVEVMEVEQVVAAIYSNRPVNRFIHVSTSSITLLSITKSTRVRMVEGQS